MNSIALGVALLLELVLKNSNTCRIIRKKIVKLRCRAFDLVCVTYVIVIFHNDSQTDYKAQVITPSQNPVAAATRKENKSHTTHSRRHNDYPQKWHHAPFSQTGTEKQIVNCFCVGTRTICGDRCD